MLKKGVAVFTALALFLGGCSEKEEVNVEKHKPAEVSGVSKDVVKVEEPVYQYPLTGLETKEESNDRAVAVIVNNHPKARPQSGLNKADIVYEVLAEGGVTRFLAIFQSEKPEKIGPVRSAREYYMHLAKGYNTFFVAHGYSPEAQEMSSNGFIDNINGMEYDGTLFKRASFRNAPHNSYITFKNILKGAEKKGYSMEGAPSAFNFVKEDENIAGEVANSLMVSYSSPSFNVIYEFDTALGKYKRFSGGVQTVDYDTNEPILLDNIFIVEANHKVIDNAGRRDINLTSGGKGYLIQKGIWNEVTWQNVEGKLLPFINGEEAGFVPGKTWINIVPNLQQSVSFEAQ